jgi:uncharacterized protein YjbJ (UPF0337 family)
MVDDSRIEGAARNVSGKLQDTVGGLTGDATAKARGNINQGPGAARKALGSATDSASEWSSVLADTVKERPLTSLLVAATVGYLFRMLTHTKSH